MDLKCILFVSKAIDLTPSNECSVAVFVNVEVVEQHDAHIGVVSHYFSSLVRHSFIFVYKCMGKFCLPHLFRS